MRFFTTIGFAATLLTAVVGDVVVTETDVVYRTDLVYVDGAGHTLSEFLEPVGQTPAPAPPSAAPVLSSCTTTTTAAAATTTTSSPTYGFPLPNTSQPAQHSQVSITTQAATTLQTYASTTPNAASATLCPEPSTFYDAAVELCHEAKDPAYCKAALGAHNLHRSNHSAPAMAWNKTLEGWAQLHTDQCIAADYTHDNNNLDLHQSNMYVGNGTGGTGGAERAAHAWYNEVGQFEREGLYGQSSYNGSVFDPIGHFTTMVWHTFTTVGCATTLCSNASGFLDAHLTLCFYSIYDLTNADFAKQVHRSNGCPQYEYK